MENRKPPKPHPTPQPQSPSFILKLLKTKPFHLQNPQTPTGFYTQSPKPNLKQHILDPNPNTRNPNHQTCTPRSDSEPSGASKLRRKLLPNLEPSTLNLQSSTSNPQPKTQNPQPRTLNTQPRTPNPETLNPEPQSQPCALHPEP